MQREVERYYGGSAPVPDERLTNIVAAAQETPQSFLKGLRVLRAKRGGSGVLRKIFGRKAEVRPFPFLFSPVLYS